MSAFFGEFRCDGRTADEAHIRTMAEAIPSYGCDGEGFLCRPSLGLGALQSYTTPESRFDPPILGAEADQPRLLAGNIRIDNRAELIATLGRLPATGRPVTDAELVLAAHSTWGAGCAQHLTGDFAFALWDAATQSLLLVRDQIGIAPLYYYPTAWGLIFASDLRALAAHPQGPKQLNPVAIAHHLRDAQYLLPSTTYLDGVRKLLPGHYLLQTATGRSLVAYWSPSQAPKVKLANPAAYAQRLRELFELAIACRLRSLAPIGTHLSGGLDSTAIALAAQKQLKARGLALAGAYTWLPDLRSEDDPAAPEYAATRRAEAALGFPVEGVDLSPAALLTELRRNIALEGFADLWYESLVRTKARQHGIRTLLSGWGGDEVVSSGANGFAAALFWRGRWWRLAKFARSRLMLTPEQASPAAAKPLWRRSLGFLYGQVVLPSLPKPLYRRWPGVSMASLPGFDPAAPALARLRGQMPAPPDWQKKIGKRAEMARALTAGHLQARIETWAAQGAPQGIVYCYPLLDKRLIEFCLGAPEALFASPAHTRSLFREAMRGLLPEDIRLASVKIESTRVSRLIETLHAALCAAAPDQPLPAADLGSCLAAHRHLQLQVMTAEL